MLPLHQASLRVGGWRPPSRATAVGATAATATASRARAPAATATPNGASCSLGRLRRHSSPTLLSTRTVAVRARRPSSSSSAAAAGADPPGPLSGPNSSSEREQEKKAAASPPLLLVRRLSTALSSSPSLSAGRALLAAAARSLARSFWPIVLIHSLASCATFVVHRLSHRLTNAAALLLLPAFRGGSSSSASAAAAAAAKEAILLNPWWLCPDPSVASFATGYQWLVLALFVLAFPLTVGARAWAAAATAFLCLREDEEEGGGEEGGERRAGGEGASSSSSPSTSSSSSSFKLPPLFPPVRKTLASLRAASPRAAEALPRAWGAELLVALRAVPLQALSLLLLPLPWTLPRLLDLQVAPVVAAVEGRGGRGAMERAAELTSGGAEAQAEAAAAAAAAAPGGGGDKGKRKKKSEKTLSLPFLLAPSRRRAALAWPFLLLLVAPRLLAAAKGAALAALTPRVAAALPEVPLLLAAVGGVGGVALARMSDVLPFVAWRWFVSEEREEKEKEKEKGKEKGEEERREA